jgi:NAD(P)-dependent dehydrogenase (short-subunit alcohol dehydrogenase family)
MTVSGANFRLDKKTALITGSTRGIGRAIAQAYKDAGATVIINGRNPETVAQTAEALNATAAPADISTAAGVDALFAQVPARLDILVNNASIATAFKRAEDLTEEEWDQHLDTNLKSAFLCAKAAGLRMKDQGGGAIINISSVLGSNALPRLLAYCVAKAGMDQLTRVLAVEWAAYNIRVNAIAPSYIETDLVRGLLEHPRYGPELKAKTPMGRFGKPEEIAGAAVYLASDAASYVTGHILAVDGGWLAW